MENFKSRRRLPVSNIPLAETYNLNDAAIIFGCNPQDILHFGARNQITLVAKVNRGVKVRAYEPSYDGENNGDVPIDRHVPAFVVLEQEYCIQIELNGKTEQGDFISCYFDRGQKLVKKSPKDFYKKLLGTQVWRTTEKNFYKRLELSPECLLVMHDDLELFNKEVNPYKFEMAPIEKLYYSVEEVASLLGCELNSIVEYAAQGKISVMTGVPYDVDVEASDGEIQIELENFLPEPQLLVLIPSNGSGDNLCDKFQLSSFQGGYYINLKGELKKAQLSRPFIATNPWFLRTIKNDEPRKLQLTSKHLFVLQDDLEKLDFLLNGMENADKHSQKELATLINDIPQDVISISETARVERVGDPSNPLDASPSQQIKNVSEADKIETIPVAESCERKLLAVDSEKSKSAPENVEGLKEKYYETTDVMKLVGKGRSTIHNWMKQDKIDGENGFPDPVKIGQDNTNYWHRNEFDYWLKNHYLNSNSHEKK